MLTADHVLAAFKLLSAARLRHDYANGQEMRESAEVYAAVLADMTPDQLRDAVLAYLRKPLAKDQFVRLWPDPGALLAAAPGASAAKSTRRQLKADAKGRFDAVLKLAARPGRTGGGRNKSDVEFAELVDAEGERGGDLVAFRAGVKAMGSWRALCDRDPTPFDANQFAEAYVAAVEGADLERNPTALLEVADRLALSGPVAPPPPAVELEPDPADLRPDEYVLRWTHEDCQEHRCAPSQVGRIFSRRTRPKPAIVKTPAAPLPPAAPRVWSEAHVAAGLCQAEDVGQPVPADWRYARAVR